MLGEALAAAVVGLIAVWLVLQPLTRSLRAPSRPIEPLDPEETPKGIALAALKEIEFDRETGKLSEADYEFLKAKYTGAALEALRREPIGDELTGGSDDVEAMIADRLRTLRSASASPASDHSSARPATNRACPTCGPRPEADAIFCSSCGRRLPNSLSCNRCGAPLVPDSRFCEACGRQVAA